MGINRKKKTVIGLALALLITGCKKEQLNYTEQGMEVNGGSSHSEPITSVEVSFKIDHDEMESSGNETSSVDYTEESDASMMSEEEKKDYRIAAKQLIEDNKELIIEHLTNIQAGTEQKSWSVSCMDHNEDGQAEIILTKTTVAMSGIIYYNYVYDVEGRKLFEYLSLETTEIYEDKDNGKYYFHVCSNYGTRSFVDIYGEIGKEDGYKSKIMFVEWETRDGAAQMRNEEGYYIFKDFSEEEARKMGEGYWGGMKEVLDIYRDQEAEVKQTTPEELEAYKAKFTGLESAEYPKRSSLFLILSTDEGIVFLDDDHNTVRVWN